MLPASREVRGRRQEGEENRCKDITAQVVYINVKGK